MMIIRTRGGGSKFFCLHCFKTFKSPGACCGWPLYRISYKARPPKQSAGKKEWRQFFDLFLNGTGFDESKGQLKRIIEIRKEYGLSVYEQQCSYDAMVEQHEKRFKFLDIKRHESLLKLDRYGVNTEVDAKDICVFVINYKDKHTPKQFNLNKKYYMVPIHAQEGHSIIFPQTLDKYSIYKVVVAFDKYSDKYKFKIVTNNIDEFYKETKSTTWFNNQYSVRQQFLVFDTKEKAMAFRYKYLKRVIPIFENEKLNLVAPLIKEANSDANRVSRKAPELLI